MVEERSINLLQDSSLSDKAKNLKDLSFNSIDDAALKICLQTADGEDQQAMRLMLMI